MMRTTQPSHGIIRMWPKTTHYAPRRTHQGSRELMPNNPLLLLPLLLLLLLSLVTSKHKCFVS